MHKIIFLRFWNIFTVKHTLIMLSHTQIQAHYCNGLALYRTLGNFSRELIKPTHSQLYFHETNIYREIHMPKKFPRAQYITLFASMIHDRGFGEIAILNCWRTRLASDMLDTV